MNNYQKLKELSDRVDFLIENGVTDDSPDFEGWHFEVERFLKKVYGDSSEELGRFTNIRFFPTSWGLESEETCRAFCKQGLQTAKAYFAVYLKEMLEEHIEKTGRWSDLTMPIPINTEVGVKTMNVQDNKIFIVHGHNEALKQEVARMVEKQGLEAIILSEQANRGKTIIEKFEEHSDVGAAICLFTGDDYGKAKDATSENLRARQNVVFEAGYFMGKLGRENVIIVADKNLELPSDMQGVVYTDAGNWKTEVLQELDKIGYAIDFNKLFKK